LPFTFAVGAATIAALRPDLRTTVQSSFSALEFAAKKKLTRRERFLGEIDAVTPWSELAARIEPFYPNGAGRGRPPIGLSRMLRMYVVQQCLGLSDEGIEDAIYDSQAIRGFIGIDLAREAAPDATTLLKFRRLLEAHGLTKAIFEAINAHLAAKGLLLREGSVVDATIISAPSSTKNDSGRRDPEMHQTKKGKNWFFGMKAHIGADRDSGLVHTVVGTAANISDVTVGNALLHGQEAEVFADAGYQGADKRADATGANWHVAMRPSVRRRWKKQPRIGKLLDDVERVKAAVRAKVEHPFHIVKNRFGLRKVRYRGLAKNTAHLFTLFGLANLLIAKRQLFELGDRGAC
jgi:IS5 family transposase